MFGAIGCILQLNKGDWGLESDLLWSYGKRDTISVSCFSEHFALCKKVNAPQTVNVNISGQTLLGLGRVPGDLWGSGLGLQCCAPLGSCCSEAWCLCWVRRGVPWQSPLAGEAPVWWRSWCFPWCTMVPMQLAATPVPGQGHRHRKYRPPLTALHHGVCLQRASNLFLSCALLLAHLMSILTA